jgi:hypothetical protein
LPFAVAFRRRMGSLSGAFAPTIVEIEARVVRPRPVGGVEKLDEVPVAASGSDG